MDINWINASAGLGVGVLVGSAGVGGGSLMMPIIVLLFGAAPTTAVSTDLWFAGITKMFGAWVHGKRGIIDRLIVRRLFYGGMPAALLTLW